MLDQSKLQTALAQVAPSFFVRQRRELAYVHQLWNQVVVQQAMVGSWIKQNAKKRFVSWEGDITAQHQFFPYQGEYSIVASDGSQIYSNRHTGCSWSLINVGSVSLTYGSSASAVAFTSEPFVFTGQDMFSAQSLDERRTLLELQAGIDVLQKLPKEKSLLLLDGSLVWQGCDEKLYAQYQQLLRMCHEQNMLIAGYTSVPRHCDLVGLVLALGQHDDCMNINVVTDSDVVPWFIAPSAYSICFIIPSENVSQSHAVLYAHNGYEIVRIEVPGYLAQDSDRLSFLMGLIADQVMKGYGYPVCLAEAHEQAVIPEVDRKLFYEFVDRYTPAAQQPRHSYKNLWKQRPLV